MKHEVAIGIAAGLGAVVLGLLPGVGVGLIQGLENFRRALRLDWSSMPQGRGKHESVQAPVWLAGFGVLLIALAVAAWIAQG